RSVVGSVPQPASTRGRSIPATTWARPSATPRAPVETRVANAGSDVEPPPGSGTAVIDASSVPSPLASPAAPVDRLATPSPRPWAPVASEAAPGADRATP